MTDPVHPPASQSARPTEGSSIARPAVRRYAARRVGAVLDSVAGPVPALMAGWLAALVLTSVQSPRLAALITIGFVGAFVAGLVGIGGAIILIPMLIYGPPLAGLEGLGIHAASGVTMVQVAVSGSVGMLAHRQVGNLEPSLIWSLGGSMALGSLIGALASGLLNDAALRAVFATLAAVAAALMLGGRRPVDREPTTGPVLYKKGLALTLGGVTGVLVGMVGAGGGFLLVPLMVFVLRIPVRRAVGSTLAIVAVSGLTGGIGKAVSGQIEWLLALALVVGAMPGAHLGARLSKRLSVTVLARLLGGLIALIAAKMWWDLVS